MLIERSKFLELLGVESMAPGQAYSLVSDHTSLKATLIWQDDFIEIDLSEAIDGESSLPILLIRGKYDTQKDSFSLRSEDFRSEASAPDDPRSVANAFKSLTQDMVRVGNRP